MPVLLVIGLVLVIGCLPTGGVDQSHPAIGQPMGPVELLTLDPSAAEGITEMPAIETEIPAVVVLLHVWGTWCGPCRMEYPELAAMVGEFDSNPSFRFISISTENSSDATYQSLTDETHQFFRSHDLSHPVHCDPRGTTRESMTKVLGGANLYYPTTLLLDPSGRVMSVWEGYDPAGVSQMRDMILARLNP